MDPDGQPAGAVAEGLLMKFEVTGANSLTRVVEIKNSHAYFGYQDLYPQDRKVNDLPSYYVDSIKASHIALTSEMNDFECSTTKTWRTDDPDYILCTLEPDGADNPVGGIHKVKATVTKGGVAVTDAKLFFIVDGVSAPDPADRAPSYPPAPLNEEFCQERDFGSYPIQKTDGSGKYYYIYKNNGVAGEDKITAWGLYAEPHPTDDGYYGTKFACDTITKTWSEPTVKCEIVPKHWTKKLDLGEPINNWHTITIKVTESNGDPVVNEQVNVNIDSGCCCASGDECVQDTASRLTDGNGEVSFTYYNLGTDPYTMIREGIDYITAYGEYSGGFKCYGTMKWVNPVVDCELTPLSDTNPIDDMTHTVTAFVYVPNEGEEAGVQPGTGIDNVDVYFTVEPLYSVNPDDTPTASGTVNTGTDGLGTADFSYTHNFDNVISNIPGYEQVPGYDLISASGVYNNAPFFCKAQKTWTYPSAICTLTPATATNPDGATHQVTVQVRRCDNSLDPLNCLSNELGECSVQFTVVRSDGEIGPTGSVPINVNGQATFSYTNEGWIGTEMIYATGVLRRDFVSGDYQYPFSCSATKTWQ
jgi:hypothetical protein